MPVTKYTSLTGASDGELAGFSITVSTRMEDTLCIELSGSEVPCKL